MGRDFSILRQLPLVFDENAVDEVREGRGAANAWTLGHHGVRQLLDARVG